MSFVLFLHSHTTRKSYSVVLECILKNNYIIKDESNAQLAICWLLYNLLDNVTPLFVFREEMSCCSSPSLVRACSRLEFSLKCNAANSNLHEESVFFTCGCNDINLHCIPLYENAVDLGAKWITTL